MRIFIYEFVTGGGWGRYSTPPRSLVSEGREMVRAIASDFREITGVSLTLFADARFEPVLPPDTDLRVLKVTSGEYERGAFRREVEKSDAVVLIAPELDEQLIDRSAVVEELGGRLFVLPHSVIKNASDKSKTALLLEQHGIPTPRTASMFPEDRYPTFLRFPIVVKPLFGCGSIGVEKLYSPEQKPFESALGDEPFLCQEFVPGISASIAILCGKRRNVILPACNQEIAAGSHLQYEGGAIPLPSKLNQRATSLAAKVASALGPCIGYVGVDLILGDAEDGSQDYVIEINPRLTTSYVGLRALSNTNLAQAMLDVAQGREPRLDWKPGRVRWTADGLVEYFDA